MKNLTGKQKDYIIYKIIRFKKKFNINPIDNRYIDKQVRKQMNLILPKRPKKLPNYLSDPEIEHFRTIASQFSSKHNLLTNLLIFTGLRINEARNLDIRDIDFSNHQIKVIGGKGGKDRYVPLAPHLRDLLSMYIKDRRKGALLLNRKNRQYSKRMLQHMIEQIIKKSRIAKDLSTHSLRHTFACMCYRAGLSLEKLQLLMGHSSRVTTEIYAKMELGAVKKEFLQLIEMSQPKQLS